MLQDLDEDLQRFQFQQNDILLFLLRALLILLFLLLLRALLILLFLLLLRALLILLLLDSSHTLELFIPLIVKLYFKLIALVSSVEYEGKVQGLLNLIQQRRKRKIVS
jgi:hypothetical protein